MKSISISASRRGFLRNAVRTVPAVVVTIGGAGVAVSTPETPSSSYAPTYFDASEFRLLGALVERLIPADDLGPGALDAGVAEFIDRQMNQPYGHGANWFMQPPFVAAPDEFGYQLSLSPRELYRQALTALEASVRQKYGKPFVDLQTAAQDEVIAALESGQLSLGSVPTKAFFAQLLANTHEGYFCDPKHGGNKDMAAWKMIGFPGARADYIDWVEQYGKTYPLPPVSSV
jgi:gluconate 2-dehydrogenase gamma chain